MDDAVKSYEQALKIQPDYAEAHNNLGNALKKYGQLDEAVNCYEKHSINQILLRLILILA